MLIDFHVEKTSLKLATVLMYLLKAKISNGVPAENLASFNTFCLSFFLGTGSKTFARLVTYAALYLAYAAPYFTHATRPGG